MGTGDGQRNLAVFSAFLTHRAELESTFGRGLHWDELEGRRACRISDEGVGVVTNDTEQSSHLDWFVDSIGRWMKVLPDLARLAGSVGESIASDSETEPVVRHDGWPGP